MNQIPRKKIFQEPEGYFDNLHERILDKKRVREKQVMLYRLAAAAVLVIGMAVFVFQPPTVPDATFQAQLDQEVELYISSGYWEAEDVLGLSEDPDALLDLIITEEWSGYSISEDQLENEIWY